MLEIERIAALETKVAVLSENITGLSSGIRDVGQDVLAIKLALAKESGVRSALRLAGNFIAGSVGAVVAILGLHK